MHMALMAKVNTDFGGKAHWCAVLNMIFEGLIMILWNIWESFMTTRFEHTFLRHKQMKRIENTLKAKMGEMQIQWFDFPFKLAFVTW
jgi:hypothetical protein